MSSFDDRKKGFESKFAFDAEMEFKATARRNKLLGLWAAEKLGRKGAEADAYAKDVVVADLDASGDRDVVDKLLVDFGRAGVTVPVSEIESEMEQLLSVARQQIMDGK